MAHSPFFIHRQFSASFCLTSRIHFCASFPTPNQMKALVSLGLHIGINGCALKTEEGLAMAAQIPLDR